MARLTHQKSELRKWMSSTRVTHRSFFLALWLLAFVSVFLWQRNLVVSLTSRKVVRPIPVLRRHVFNLTDFGAVADGKTINTRAFERAIAAIAAVAKKGGGQLNVEAGVWLTAPFNLTSHMTLFLSEDAVILGVQDESLWPVMPSLPSYGRGRELPGPRYGSLIHGQHLEDIVITGYNGTIDGQGQRWWRKFRSKELHYTRGRLVQFMWCKNIEISHITLRNSPFWTIHPFDCTNVTIRGVTIVNPPDAPNTDGIDPDSCQNMIVEDCYISVGDDCIAIKSGWDQYGTSYGRPSRNILIRNVTARSSVSAGVSIGSEMSGGVVNVTVEGLKVWGSRRGVRIKTSMGRGGYIKQISYRNLTFDTVRMGIVLTTNYGEHPDEKFNPLALPVVENIFFHSVHGRNIKIPLRVYGSLEVSVKNVKFKDMDIGVTKMNRRIFQCSFVQGKAVGKTCPRTCELEEIYDEMELRLRAAALLNYTDDSMALRADYCF